MELKKNYQNIAYLFTKILIISWQTEIKRGFVKKTRAMKFKIQKKHMKILMFSPEFNLKKENSATCLFYLLTLESNIKFICL